MTWPSITNMLPFWGWGLMAAVPVAIVLLYFLKLKRQPVEVPSTYLWHKSIEDLHVNSIWQRLRSSLLLLLQLLIILLAILALLRPSWSGKKIIDERSIFVIDNSASMSAKDVTSGGGTITRLAEAKRQVLELIGQMESDDVAMVISVSNRPTVEHPFTADRHALRRAVEKIKPSHKSTDVLEALRVASGIANPNRAGTDRGVDVMVADPVPADLYLFTDGNFVPPDFSFGNLHPLYIKIGSEQPKNVAITAFSAERLEDKPGEIAVFGLIENYGPDDVEVLVDLYLDDVDQGATVKVQVPGLNDEGEPGSNGVDFTLKGVESGVLKLHVAGNDVLDIDDTAWYTVNAPSKANVLLVTSGNPYLEFAFQTERATKLAKVFVPKNGPDYLSSEEYRYEAQTGAYDLIIYDRCLPAAAKDNATTPTPMPQCSTWIIGRVPKLPEWGWQPGKPWPPQEMVVPRLIDTAKTHPLMQLVELGNVVIASGVPLKTPPGGTTLLDMVGSIEVKKPKSKDEPGEYEQRQASMLSIGPREGHEDCIMGFSLLDEEDQANTNWVKRRAFPVFIYNVLKYLGGGQSVSDTGTNRPGDPVELKIDTDQDKLDVRLPGGEKDEIGKSRETTFRFSNTDRVGAYEIRTRGSDAATVGRFAVNLFDSRESNLKPVKELNFKGWGKKVQAQTNFQPERKEYWKWLLLLALLVLVFEWYVYNRRVYL